jgi:hypothetical protein
MHDSVTEHEAGLESESMRLHMTNPIMSYSW